MSAAAQSDPSTENQLFVQHRLAQFGKIAGFGGMSFWLFNVTAHLPRTESPSVLAHGLAFHFLGAASLILLVTIALVYRSVRFGLITVIPNMFPLVATGALLVGLGKFLDLSAVCAFTVCLGIAVDDTIHFMSRFQFERPGRSVTEAVRRTYYCVGTPMVTTTVIMVAGFSTVLASDLPMQRTFASMACMTLGSALVGDLVFLPALLASFVPQSADSAASLPPPGRSV